MRSHLLLLLALLTFVPPLYGAPSPSRTAPARVTILYDAFGGAPGLTEDWGFATLIEYGGRRILSDIGIPAWDPVDTEEVEFMIDLMSTLVD